MIETILQFLEEFAATVSLPVFVFVGSILEEIIAIIPSPFVMMLAGSLAAAESSSWFYVFFVAVVATIAKTIGCWIYYIIADKAEDIIASKYGKYLGISHKSIESIGEKFSKGTKEFWIILGLRAMPLMPSAPVSIAAGVIKMDMKKFILASFIGLLFRGLFFMYIGYTATGSLENIQSKFNSIETILQIIILVLAAIALLYFWKKRQNIQK